MFSFVTQYNHIKWKQSINQHGSDRFWDTSRYHPKLSDSIFLVKVTEGYGVQEGQTENFGFGCRMRKTALELLLSSQDRTHSDNRKNEENPGNNESAHFRHSEHQNSVIFQDI